MKLRIINIYDMLKGVSRHLSAYPLATPNAEVTANGAIVNGTITAIDAAATKQVDGKADTSGGVRTKRQKVKELRDYLKDVARVGRSLDPDTHPGLAAHFVLPHNRAYAVAAASARAMIAAATDVEPEMIAAGLPATFLADLNALLAAFEDGVDAKIDGLQTQVSGTSGLAYRAKQGMKAAKKLDAIMRAIYRNDPVMLAVWTHARHVERSLPGESATPPTDGTGSGTGGTSSGGSETPVTQPA